MASKVTHPPRGNAAVVWHPPQCPACLSADVYVYKSNPPWRYHACRRCSKKFTSREVLLKKPKKNGGGSGKLSENGSSA